MSGKIPKHLEDWLNSDSSQGSTILRPHSELASVSVLDRAYEILKAKGPMRGSDLGWELWGATTECANRGTGSQRHNKFCRAAGKVLKRLERLGKATWQPRKNHSVWRARSNDGAMPRRQTK